MARYQFLFTSLLTITVLSRSHSSGHIRSKVKVANVIVKTLDEINKNNNKIKELIKSFFDNRPIEEECVCVPFHLCNNGDINKDGRHVFQPRFAYKSTNPCKGIAEICCEPYEMSTLIANGVTEAIPDNMECGYGTQIVGNYSDTSDLTETKFGEYPWTAIVLNRTFHYQCSGSLIHPEVILTSGHCVNVSSEYLVRVGEWNITSTSEPYPHQDRNVSLIVKHPKFNVDNLVYDAALLFMEKPFKLDVNVNTVCLPGLSPQRASELTGCAATGFGKDSPKGYFRRVMKKIKFYLVPNSECQSQLRETRLGRWFELHPSFICAFGEDGRDLCVGDGGGPLMCEIPGQSLRYQQTGITSWGIDCAQGSPSVFTKVSLIRSWIDGEFRIRNLNSKYYTYSAA